MMIVHNETNDDNNGNENIHLIKSFRKKKSTIRIKTVCCVWTRNGISSNPKSPTTISFIKKFFKIK